MCTPLNYCLNLCYYDSLILELKTKFKINATSHHTSSLSYSRPKSLNTPLISPSVGTSFYHSISSTHVLFQDLVPLAVKINSCRTGHNSSGKTTKKTAEQIVDDEQRP